MSLAHQYLPSCHRAPRLITFDCFSEAKLQPLTDEGVNCDTSRMHQEALVMRFVLAVVFCFALVAPSHAAPKGSVRQQLNSCKSTREACVSQCIDDYNKSAIKSTMRRDSCRDQCTSAYVKCVDAIQRLGSTDVQGNSGGLSRD